MTMRWPPIFCAPATARAIRCGGCRLWQAYRETFKSTIADLNNVSEVAFAGAITAALYLAGVRAGRDAAGRISTPTPGTPRSRPGRPEGGEALGLRAAYADRARFGQ